MQNWVVADVAADLTTEELESGGFYAALRSRGIWPHCVTRRVSARAAGPVEAEQLGLEVGAPLLSLESRMQDTSGRRVEVSVQYYDGTNYTMEMTIVEA